MDNISQLQNDYFENLQSAEKHLLKSREVLLSIDEDPTFKQTRYVVFDNLLQKFVSGDCWVLNPVDSEFDKRVIRYYVKNTKDSFNRVWLKEWLDYLDSVEEEW